MAMIESEQVNMTPGIEARHRRSALVADAAFLAEVYTACGVPPTDIEKVRKGLHAGTHTERDAGNPNASKSNTLARRQMGHCIATVEDLQRKLHGDVSQLVQKREHMTQRIRWRMRPHIIHAKVALIYSFRKP